LNARREFIGTLLSGAALAPWSQLSLAGQARGNDSRLVLLILRGGMDGLSAVPLPADQPFISARGPLAQMPAAPLPLEGPFALHPWLAEMHAMYGRQELLVLHATGLPYRERSHFDAQDYMETGTPDQKGTGVARGRSIETWIYNEYTYANAPYAYPYGPYGYGGYFGGGAVVLRHHHHHQFVIIGDPFFDPFYYSYLRPSVAYPAKTVTFSNGRVVSIQILSPPRY
jgi:hypothetical protein